MQTVNIIVYIFKFKSKLLLIMLFGATEKNDEHASVIDNLSFKLPNYHAIKKEGKCRFGPY